MHGCRIGTGSLGHYLLCVLPGTRAYHQPRRGTGALALVPGPSTRWLEALPVGNGRLGAMVFGGVERERFALNESTVWSGAPSDRHDNPSGREHLAEIRRLLFEGKYILASALCEKHIFGREDSYGTHLPMADLLLDFNLGGKEVRDYRRELIWMRQSHE